MIPLFIFEFTVIRFESEHRARCIQLENDFRKFETMYRDAKIERVNCGKHLIECIRNGVWETPKIMLYNSDNGEKVFYDGGMSYESIADWVFRYTGMRGYQLTDPLRSPNNRTLHEMIANNKCVFVMFHHPDSKASRRFLPAMEKIAKTYDRDDGIEIAEIDVDKFKSFRFDFHISKFPEFKLFVNSSEKKYTGKANMYDAVDFINDFCGVSREIGGSQNGDFGVVDELGPIVDDFMKTKNPKYIKEASEYPDSRIYVQIMEAVLSDGPEYLYREKERLEPILESSNTDQIKRRLNIINVFLQ